MNKNFLQQPPGEDTKKRAWFITIPGDEGPDQRALERILNNKEARKAYSRITAQREISSKEKYNHFHILLECKNQVLFSTVKNLFPRGHISFVSGKTNLEKARKYTTKERTRIEGPWIVEDENKRKRPPPEAKELEEGEKKRSKLEMTFDLIESGEISRYQELPPSIQMTANYKYACAVIDRFNPPDPLREIKVLVLYNGSGYGKSKNARLCLPDSGLVSFSRGEKAWFDGYEGEDALIIDEFEWGALPHSKFKQLLSGDLKKLEVKGSFVAARYTKIVITTNSDPRKWGGRGYFATVTSRSADGTSIARRQWFEDEDDGSGTIKSDDLTAIRRRLGLHPRSDPSVARCVDILDIVDESEKNNNFGNTPKTWRNIQEIICDFFKVPLPEDPRIQHQQEEEEEEASLLNPQVVDLRSISPSQSPPFFPSESPDLLDPSPAQDEIAGKNERFYIKTLPRLIEKYQQIGEFSRQEAEPLAKDFLDECMEKASKSGRLLKDIYKEQFNDSDSDD